MEESARSTPLSKGGVLVLFMASAALATPAFSQDALPEIEAARPSTARAVTDARDDTPMPEVDVEARFEVFQREFAAAFGGEVERRNGSETGDSGFSTSLEASLEKRWEGSAAYRWYRRLSGVYERFEVFYEGLERSTRWATSGFEVDPDVDRVIDGKLGLRVERELGDFDLGLDVDDAIDGRLGLYFGGDFRGYDISFDVSDIVDSGRFGFRLRRKTK